MSPHPHPPVCRACWSCWCACLGATLLTACATPRSDAHLLALRGGVLDPTRPYVVSLGDAEGFVCTGTIVSPHVVLTAGHCGTTRHLDWVEVGTEHIPITERVRHPDYGAPFHENDLQLLRTSEALGLEPAPLLREELDNSARFVGPPWTFVGRGRLEPGGSFGEPHVMVRPIRSVARGLYTFDGMTGAVDPTELLHEGDEAGMCPGDSGAPGFVVVDGIERLAAVHSRSEPSCSGVALAARADLPAIGLFLQPTIDRFEDAEPCRADGACAPECEGESRVRDPDCAALHGGADGVCAASCVRPVDPDCSIEACVADGRCVPSCALDPDCSEPPPPAAD
ncbi:MAG: S1 family peptidase, partial [Sandaracinaceae bacterium]|nr:S1 family peptidase [Sandaracinaceae bacterium]